MKQPEKQTEPSSDKIFCAYCGTEQDGKNEFLECENCKQEGPGCWSHDFIDKNNLDKPVQNN